MIRTCAPLIRSLNREVSMSLGEFVTVWIYYLYIAI